MNFKQPSRIIAASAIAIVLLVLFQLNWLQRSRQLVEEQFDQKVTMALCSAIEELGESKTTPVEVNFSCTPTLQQCSATNLRSNVASDELQGVLQTAMSRYQIDLDYDFEVIPEPLHEEATAVYCSSLDPLEEEDYLVTVQFEGKKAYVAQRMGLMAGSTIVLLLFVCGLFTLTLYRLVQQKRMHAVSVDLFNNMAHEFRTPLTNISLALKLLQKRQVNPGNLKYLEVIKNENTRLNKQIECMLHTAKLEQGDYDLTMETIEAETSIRRVVEDMKFRIEERGASVEFPTSQSNVKLWADPLHFSNVVRNLIDNALKYAGEQPTIQINLHDQLETCRIDFQDNGIGMTREQIKTAFAPFHQMQNGKAHRNGFGLGLYYVRQIVEKHGGMVWLESEPNHGCTFSLCFPKKSA